VRLERAGLIRRGVKALPRIDTRADTAVHGARVLDALLEERRSGR
jgi:hypothetical protein